MEIEDYKKFLKKELSDRRYHHSLNVAEMARHLAHVWGYNEDIAYIAGLLHDCAKEMPKETQKELILSSGYELDYAELVTDKLWHGIAGAQFIKTNFGIENREILDSIRFHTVGRKNMTLLDEIIYVADYISADRKMPVVPEVRALADKDLKLAVLSELRNSIVTTAYKGGFIPKCTLDAYNHYLKYSEELNNK